jgi:hypothetical protein
MVMQFFGQTEAQAVQPVQEVEWHSIENLSLTYCP